MLTFVFTFIAFVTGVADTPKKKENFVIKTLNVDPACFHICGESQAKVDSAKQEIQKLISTQYSSVSIPDNIILSLSEADRRRIVDIQKTTSVSISTEEKQGQISLSIKGISLNVIKASNEIHDLLREARCTEDRKKKIELTSQVAAWKYQGQGSQFHDFDLETNYELEQALQKKTPHVKVTIKGQQYTVQMPNGPATNNQGSTLEIIRIDKMEGISLVSSDW